MRSCPRCHVELEPTLERALATGRIASLAGPAVELERCPNCAGHFLDAGELGLVSGAVGLDAVVAPPRVRHVDGARCPACHSTMAFREFRGVVVDACPLCGGFWLDRGEIADLRHALQTPGPPPG